MRDIVAICYTRHVIRHQDSFYLPGNKLTLLSTGRDAFASMLGAIASARETIHLEAYIFNSDRTGSEFGRLLREKARAGVRVRVIIDAVGSLNMSPEFLTQLRNSGISVLEYHPVAPWRSRWAWDRRDHRKILVVDGRIGFTGGINISDDHAPAASGGSDWRDTHVRVEGPAAYDLDRLFRAVWYKESGRWFDSAGQPSERRGPSQVWVAANEEFLHRYRIRNAYIKALRAARREVLIANAYFIPDRGIRKALGAAVKRGVSVQILVPGRSDVRSVWYAGRRRYETLLRRGVRLYEWQGPNLHAKTAVIDGQWCTVGTYNLDHRSLFQNLEVNLHILDPEIASQMAQKFHEDLAAAREIKLGAWRRRPFLDKFLEHAFYLFRYFF